MNEKAQSPKFYRTDLQGMRALAVISVVLYHAKIPFFSGGYVGVDIFFVLSGYLITRLITLEIANTGHLDLLGFYARRIRRLLPAAFVVLLVTALFSMLLLSPIELRELIASMFYTVFYASNVWFANSAMDYLGNDLHSNPVLHTWSLSVEEQFYLVWPLIILMAYKLVPINSIYKRLFIVTVSVGGISFAFSLWVIEVSQPWAFFSSPTRAWEFAAGALGFLVTNRLSALKPLTKNLLFVAGIAIIVQSILTFDDHTRFPGTAALIPVVGTFLVILSGLSASSSFSNVFNSHAIQTIGNLSYSWYLWHWPAQVFYEHYFTPSSVLESLIPPLVSLVLARLTYQLLENKVRFSPFLSATSLRSVFVGLGLTASAAIVIIGLRFVSINALNSPEQKQVLDARAQIPATYHDGCHLGLLETEFGICAYGNENSGTTIVLFGDSHAAQWFPALKKIINQKGWRLVSLTKSACPTAFVSSYNKQLGRLYKECAEWRDKAIERLAIEAPQLVIIGNSSRHINPDDSSLWHQGMKDSLQAITTVSNAKIAVLGDTPWPGFDVPVCLSRALWHQTDELACSFNNSDTLRDLMIKADQKAVDMFPTSNLIDLSSSLCNETSCTATVSGEIGYRDSHHLTLTASEKLAPVLDENIKKLFTNVL